MEKLVTQVRALTTCDILIAVNGDYNQKFNEDYRKQILDLKVNLRKQRNLSCLT